MNYALPWAMTWVLQRCDGCPTGLESGLPRHVSCARLIHPRMFPCRQRNIIQRAFGRTVVTGTATPGHAKLVPNRLRCSSNRWHRSERCWRPPPTYTVSLHGRAFPVVADGVVSFAIDGVSGSVAMGTTAKGPVRG